MKFCIKCQRKITRHNSQLLNKKRYCNECYFEERTNPVPDWSDEDFYNPNASCVECLYLRSERILVSGEWKIIWNCARGYDPYRGQCKDHEFEFL